MASGSDSNEEQSFLLVPAEAPADSHDLPPLSFALFLLSWQRTMYPRSPSPQRETQPEAEAYGPLLALFFSQ